MKRSVTIMKTAAALVVVMLLLSSCSRKNVNMSKHRKSRKCNCPTFAENHTQTTTPDATTTYFGQ